MCIKIGHYAAYIFIGSIERIRISVLHSNVSSSVFKLTFLLASAEAYEPFPLVMSWILLVAVNALQLQHIKY